MNTKRDVPAKLHDILSPWEVEAQEVSELRDDRVFGVKTACGHTLILKDLGSAETRILGMSKQESEDRLEQEHRILTHLDDEGVPVAIPLQTKDRRTWSAFDGHLYTLSPCLRRPGAWHSNDWPKVGPVFGAAIATLHRALSSFPDPGTFEAGPWNNDPIALFDLVVPELFEVLSEDRSGKVRSAIDAVEPRYRHHLSGLDRQLIHRDCHVGNVLADGNEIVGIADFDHLSIGSVVFDLAYFFVHQIMWGIDDPEKYRSWYRLMGYVISGYNGVRPLSLYERRAVPYMMILMQIMFANGKTRRGKTSESELDLRKLLHVCQHRDAISGIFAG